MGEGCKRYNIGDWSVHLVPGGGYAEYCVAAEDNCLPIPAGMTLIEAAGLPETYFTVWTNVFQRGALQAGETFLVHGGTSGIGSTAIILARHFGAKVIATAGSDEKCDACLKPRRRCGHQLPQPGFCDVMKEKGLEANLVLDMVGGDYVARNFNVMATGRAHCSNRLSKRFKT